MAGGFVVPKTGEAGVAETIVEVQRQQANTRSANDFESAVIGAGGITVKDGGGVVLLDSEGRPVTQIREGSIVADDPDTGAALMYFGGSLFMWDDRAGNPEGFGQIYTDPGAGSRLVRIFPPHDPAASGLENSLTLQGTGDAAAGNAWMYSDGQITLRVQNAGGTRVGTLSLAAARVDIDANHLGLYSLPTTSSGANLHLGTVGGQFTVALVTSSERYKQDIADAEIDPDAVLRWVPRTWRDKHDVAAVGDDAAEHVGFIAEEIHAETPEFVNLDDEGRPDSLKYDRMVAGLHAVVKAQAELLDELKARVASLEAQQ
ncbi:hypothetical protein HMPREF0063_11903 [Aeromicrobium marinum DSM 15272]|uniref:Peptidase S74 domain-containing protein n=1 Tax=Aeromicrobium marinum DSM 15272 TaxID=585531 RepID=E2SDW7_9ACTN|nr:tail fiber domain-containing protein [Aeromicrobium marinum]EFQ82694.1 hypothetical protein HMPREF0063_11903 [Aeromicrobium marinum DSM 15272]